MGVVFADDGDNLFGVMFHDLPVDSFGLIPDFIYHQRSVSVFFGKAVEEFSGFFHVLIRMVVMPVHDDIYATFQGTVNNRCDPIPLKFRIMEVAVLRFNSHRNPDHIALKGVDKFIYYCSVVVFGTAPDAPGETDAPELRRLTVFEKYISVSGHEAALLTGSG